MAAAVSDRLLAAALAASFGVTVSVASRVQRQLAAPGPDRLYAQDGAGGADGQSRTYQRLRQTPQLASAEYGFVNFNRDFLTIHFQLPRQPYEAYVAAWGYRESDLAGLRSWHDQARQAAFERAKAQGQSQAQLDQQFAALKAQYDRKVHDYMASKDFHFLPDNSVEVDMPKIVRENTPLVKSLAGAFDQIAESRRYDSGNIIGAVAALIQTAVIYRVPPPVVNGVHNGGFWPPLQTLIGGWGDCDTKTGALASILANWPQMRMVGLALPEHYLMGVLRIPNKGDLFVEYQGLQYILVEPAGPAWLTPGSVSEHTQDLMEASQGYRIEPFFSGA